MEQMGSMIRKSGRSIKMMIHNRGHYITNPNNAFLKANPLKLAYICSLWSSPKWIPWKMIAWQKAKRVAPKFGGAATGFPIETAGKHVLCWIWRWHMKGFLQNSNKTSPFPSFLLKFPFTANSWKNIERNNSKMQEHFIGKNLFTFFPFVFSNPILEKNHLCHTPQVAPSWKSKGNATPDSEEIAGHINSFIP